MAENKEILRTNIIQGFGTLIVREFLLKLISFFGQVFLARLLFPSDFGIYVIIVFVINFFSLFTDIGLSLAIIQKRKEPTATELSSIFLLKMFLSTLIVFLIWIFAPFIKLFYPTFVDANILMLRIFSLSLLFSTARTIPISLLERKIKYNLISSIDIMGVFLYYVVSLVAAFMHLGSWSFIIGALTKEIVETIILYYIQPFFPQFTFSKDSIKKMIKFGMYIQGNALVNVINSSITPVIGGRISGIYSVGLLDFAYNIASLPIIIAFNFGRVAFAGYARIQEEKELLFRAICKSVSLLAIILYIFPVIIFGLGNELVSFIFSAKWLPAVPALYWYSLGAFFLPAISSLGQGILVIGRSKEIFWLSFATTTLGFIGAIFLISLFGFVGISVIFFLTTFFLFVFYPIILKKANLEFPIITIISPKLLVALISLLFIFFMNGVFSRTFPFLILKLTTAVFFYIALMFILAKQDSKELLRLVINWLFPKRV